MNTLQQLGQQCLYKSENKLEIFHNLGKVPSRPIGNSIIEHNVLAQLDSLGGTEHTDGQLELLGSLMGIEIYKSDSNRAMVNIDSTKKSRESRKHIYQSKLSNINEMQCAIATSKNRIKNMHLTSSAHVI